MNIGHRHITKGDIKETLLKLFKKKHVDLFIMGNKRDQIGASIFSMILTKISCCSILLIPENGSQAIKKIMVPIDFSEASKLAVETAQNLSKQNNAFFFRVFFHNFCKFFKTFSCGMVACRYLVHMWQTKEALFCFDKFCAVSTASFEASEKSMGTMIFLMA